MPKPELPRLCPPPPPPPAPCLRERLVQPASASPADGGVQEACRRRGILLDFAPHRIRLRSVKPIPQSGPTCGPVALSMVLGPQMPPELLVSMARESGLSNNGEIFSCEFMAQLARNAAKRVGLSLEIAIKDNLFEVGVVRELLDGAVLLVPYDSDRNFAPCHRRGHSAHWALIVGVLELKRLPPELSADETAINMSEDNIYVLARHGKSGHLAAWSLAELSSSNRNLCEFPAHRERDGLDYVVPEGGIAGAKGLCSRFLLVRGA